MPQGVPAWSMDQAGACPDTLPPTMRRIRLIMKIEDDNGISSLLRSEDSVLCGGFGFTEGPVWVASDNALLFSDIPGNRTHRWRPGSSAAEVYRDPSGWANGLTLDHLNRLVACEHGGRRVSRGAYGSP